MEKALKVNCCVCKESNLMESCSYRIYKRQCIKLESLHIGELTVGWPLAFKERKEETSRDNK